MQSCVCDVYCRIVHRDADVCKGATKTFQNRLRVMHPNGVPIVLILLSLPDWSTWHFTSRSQERVCIICAGSLDPAVFGAV